MPFVVNEIILLFFIYSVIGWLMETVVTFIDNKKLVNRGFLIGPYCPIYGFACICIIIFLNKYMDDPFAMFIFASIVCSVLEYLTSFIMEKMFKARWWDYSHKKFNVNGRICLVNSVIFGLLAFFIMYLVNPYFVSLIEKMPVILTTILSYSIIVVMIVDFAFSMAIMEKIKNISFEVKKDNTYEITKKVKEILSSKNIFIKRINSAFPNLKSTLKSKRQEVKEKKEEILRNIKKNIHLGNARLNMLRGVKLKEDSNLNDEIKEDIGE